MEITRFGWNDSFKQKFDDLKRNDLLPARVFSEDKGSYMLMSEVGSIVGRVSGKYRHETENRSDFPAVGDWVAIEVVPDQSLAIIHALLPRNTMFSRKTAGTKIEEQVVAANIDTVFIVYGLDNNFNVRGIERYVTLAWGSGAQPVIILNKADLVEDQGELEKIRSEVELVAIGIPIYFISSVVNDGISELKKYFKVGSTVALLGSSGVGKSTLTNLLLGDLSQKTGEVREADSKGRHTTTRRSIFMLPNEGMIVDTPGMRELQLWMNEQDLSTGFNDIETIALKCRFKDCKHEIEPGCAVKEAIEQGDLDNQRLVSHDKMLRELKHLVSKQDQQAWNARLEDRKFGKERHNYLKHKRR
jgi:ribosome biogenesis GTPase